MTSLSLMDQPLERYSDMDYVSEDKLTTFFFEYEDIISSEAIEDLP